MQSKGLDFISLDRPTSEHARSIHDTAEAILNTGDSEPPRLLIVPDQSPISSSRVAEEVRSSLGLGIIDSHSLFMLGAIANLRSPKNPFEYFHERYGNLASLQSFGLSSDGSLKDLEYIHNAEIPAQTIQDLVHQFSRDPAIYQIVNDIAIRIAINHGFIACLSGKQGHLDSVYIRRDYPGEPLSLFQAELTMDEIKTGADLSEADNLALIIEGLRLRTARESVQ